MSELEVKTSLARRAPDFVYPPSMPLPFAPLVGFALGVLLAWLAWGDIGRHDGPFVASRPFIVVTALAALVFAPVLGYFAAFHGDWAYLYLLPWAKIPSALDLLLVLVGAGAMPLGFALAVPWVRKRRNGALTVLAATPLAIAVALLAVTMHRLGVSATYAQFHGGFGAQPITATSLGRGVLWMLLMLALGTTWSARALWAMTSEAKR
jgi:hypothetical protein